LDTAAIDAYIEYHMAENQIPGLALSIVHNNEIVYTRGYGVAGTDGTQVTPKTPFIIGSTSKSFTALAIMQLVETGEIELDASVQTYLPWFTMAGPEDSSLITVRHLLTHTSGLSGPVSDKDIVNPDLSIDALENHIREVADYKLINPAGESYQYNNTNYDILGLIVQIVSGKSFEDYIETNIYSPLEMYNSYTAKSEAEKNGLAVGHTYFFNYPRTSDNAPYSRRKLPSGFLISSAEDLGHYLIAQINQGSYGGVEILSPDYMALMHQPAVETMDEGIFYGFGWRTNHVEEQPSVWHGGDTSSSHSNLAFSTKNGWGVAILVNVAGLPKNAALNEPVNEVMRLASGVSAGQIMTDFSVIFMVLWAIALISAGLNLLFMWIFIRKYRKKGIQPKLVRTIIIPILLNFPLVYFMFYGFPRSQSSTAAVMFEFLPDTSLIFLVCVGIIFFTLIFRCVVYYRSRKTS
jgi:CubicO group peptidase (beta-lactamase class C family)